MAWGRKGASNGQNYPLKWEKTCCFDPKKRSKMRIFSHFQLSRCLQSESSNARKGIKTTIFSGTPYSFAAWRSESSNARKGIKTFRPSLFFHRYPTWSESSNARKGIKTVKAWIDAHSILPGLNHQMPVRALRLVPDARLAWTNTGLSV